MDIIIRYLSILQLYLEDYLHHTSRVFWIHGVRDGSIVLLRKYNARRKRVEKAALAIRAAKSLTGVMHHRT